jgi:hypothetical protein
MQPLLRWVFQTADTILVAVGNSGQAIDRIHGLDGPLGENVHVAGESINMPLVPIALLNQPGDLFVVRTLQCCYVLQLFIEVHI